MEPKTLEERIEECVNSGDEQLHQWLLQLQSYIERDTPMEVVVGSLSCQYQCPKCKKMMKLGVIKGYCNECGQAIK